MTSRPALLPKSDPLTATRIAGSMRPTGHWSAELAGFQEWFAACRRHTHGQAERVELDRLDGWHRDPSTGNIRHHTGKFFTIAGLSVDIKGGPVEHWQQPIILQPEVGILGVLVKEFDGVLHCLMQAKIEPGNANGLQVSPTVQATRSNYTRVHGGKAVPYLEYFLGTTRSVVMADVRQSEQGTWFLHKRNRNMVVEVTGDVEVLGIDVRREGFARSVRNLGPGELHPCKMRRFDQRPQPQPMNPLLKPVMIRRYYQKNEHQGGQGHVAGVVQAGAKQRHGADDAGDENRQAVGRKAGAEGGSPCDEPVDSADQPLQLSGPRECRHRR